MSFSISEIYFSVDKTPYTMYIYYVKGKEVIKKLKKEGWLLRRVSGSHHVLEKKGIGIVSVPCHNIDLSIGTLKAISKQTGVPLP